jgi:DNA-binding FrmR family transcriptional regulator
MSHTIKEKQNLILSAKRIQGQVEALVWALDEERDCSRLATHECCAENTRPHRSKWPQQTK